MYCWQCGKKIKDTMLYCPFCGAKIELPEQDEAEESVNRPAVVLSALDQLPKEPFRQAEPAQPATTADRQNEAEAPAVILEKEPPFVPLEQDESIWNIPDAEADDEPEETASVIQPRGSSSADAGDMRRTQKRQPELERTPDDPAPRRRFNPNDIFLDGEDGDSSDYDEEYDDDEEESFVLRHIRGLVALGLFAVLVAILLGWAFSSSGQKTLARIGIVWNKAVYAELAAEAQQNGQDLAAADYYAKALEGDAENYSYAYNAAVLYLNNGDNQRSAEMARKAAAINPTSQDLRELLERLYPDPATRPDDIAQILGQSAETKQQGIILEVGG